MQFTYRAPTSTYSGMLIPMTNGLSRKEPRAALRRACLARAMASDGESTIEINGEIINFSQTGLAMQLAGPLPVGVGVEIEMTATDETSGRLKGRVMHCRRVLTGTFEVGVALFRNASSGRAS